MDVKKLCGSMRLGLVCWARWDFRSLRGRGAFMELQPWI